MEVFVYKQIGKTFLDVIEHDSTLRVAILALNISSVDSNSIPIYKSINILLSCGILLMPILDMSFVILKRLYLRKSPFYPDRSHFHHQLLSKGLSHKTTVHVMHSITTMILVCIMSALEIDIALILLPIFTFTFIVLFIELFYKYKITEKNYYK